jgi:hypothetical protein
VEATGFASDKSRHCGKPAAQVQRPPGGAKLASVRILDGDPTVVFPVFEPQ